MKIKDVAKLSPLDRFLYWIRERHSIYLKKEAGEPKPWTDDEVLRSFFFTNPYRENDKVTRWFRENIREPLRDDPRVLMATVIFRWFNLPHPTGRFLMAETMTWKGKRDFATVASTKSPLQKLETSLLCDWDSSYAVDLLDPFRRQRRPIFTGAFMINSPPGEPKLEAICRRIDNVWKKREELLEMIVEKKPTTLEWAHHCLTDFDGLGGFMAYEVVTDLRWTYLLENASDKETWCNPGPGCIRGLHRLYTKGWKPGRNTGPVRKKPGDWQRRMQVLLSKAQLALEDLPPLEMREIEHSLCEWDKYERARLGDGRLKRKYNGAGV